MTTTTQFRVLNFDCPSCASTIERALRSTSGVEGAEVHYTTGRIEVRYDDAVVDPETFVEVIENRGYTPQPA